MSTGLAVRRLEPEAFARYGTVVERPGRGHDAEGPGWRWWAETLRPGRGVILAPGVWHGAPLAASGPAAAMVLLRERTGVEDTAMVRFETVPVARSA